MADFNMSKLWLGKDGYYRDLNGNIIAQKGEYLNPEVYDYLAKKYGQEYADRTSVNTKHGNIYQNGRWRFNDIQSDKEGRTATWEEAASRIKENAKGAKKTKFGYVIKDDGEYYYLNQDSKDRQTAWKKAQKAQLQKAQKAQLQKAQKANEDEFTWNDLNPFKKDSYKGNLIDAGENINSNIKGLCDAWSNYKDRVYKGIPFTERFSGLLGTLGKSASSILGATIGTGLQLVLPQKYKKILSRLGSYADVGKDANSLRSLFTNGWEGAISPDDPRNKGFLDKGFEFLGDEQSRQDLQDFANGVMAIWGTKGIKGGISSLKSGVSGAMKNGVKTTLKNNYGTIAKHTPIAANVYHGVEAAKYTGKAARNLWDEAIYTGKAFLPRQLKGSAGFKESAKSLGKAIKLGTVTGPVNTAKAGWQGFLASDPTMSLFPYIHTGYMIQNK